MARGRGTAPLPHPTASSLTLTDAHEEPGERHVHRALHLDIPTTVCIQMSTPDSNEVGTGQHHDRDPCRLPGHVQGGDRDLDHGAVPFPPRCCQGWTSGYRPSSVCPNEEPGEHAVHRALRVHQ